MELTEKQLAKLNRRTLKNLLVVHDLFCEKLLDKTILPPDLNKIKYRLKQLEADITYFSKKYLIGEDEDENDSGW